MFQFNSQVLVGAHDLYTQSEGNPSYVPAIDFALVSVPYARNSKKSDFFEDRCDNVKNLNFSSETATV